jgi:hypothetical protein
MRNRIFPYQTLEGDVRLRLHAGGLDDGDWPRSPYTPDNRLVQLHELDKEDWQIAQFNVEVTVPAEEVQKLNERGAAVRVFAVAQCTGTQYRATIQLVSPHMEPAKWGGTIEMARDNFHGKVTVHALVVGEVHGSSNRYLAISDAWTIYFDEPDIPPLTGTMRVRWVDFDNPGDLRFLIAFTEHAFYSDLDSAQPTLYLNASKKFEGFTSLLGDRKRTPAERPLHNAERVSIARTVWMALFNTSIASMAVDDDAELDWPAEDWKRKVLRKMLARIYPLKSDSERLQAAHEAWNSNERAGHLESLAQVKIDAMNRVPRLLRLTLDFINKATTTTT